MRRDNTNRRNSHLHRSFLLSRRAFLRTMALVGSGVSLSSLAACAPGPQAATGGEPAAQQASTGPKPGGIFRIAGQGDIRSLDPPGAESSEDWWSAGMVLYNQLYFYDKDGAFYADLAADLPSISEDGRVYSIPLRQGVKFHNGREFVAADAKFTLEHQLWPEVYSWGKTYMENIEGYDAVIDGSSKELTGIKAVDDYTVEITLKQPQAVFPALLSMSMNGIIPMEETLQAGEDFGYSVIIGTGPFRFVEWAPGERCVYERNPDYFKSGLPYFDGIELYINVDPAVQMLRWESGEIEWVHNIPAAELPRLMGDPELQKLMRTAPTVGTTRLAMHFKVPPFDDINVRKAVAMAIDKEAIARKRSGLLIPLEGYYAVPMLQYSADFKSNYQYDPEAAKALMAEAGHADGVSGVKFYIGQSSEEGQLIQADLQNIGIETELMMGQWKEWRDGIRAGDIALFMYGWAASFPDAFDFTSAWTTCASSETGYNDGFYCNERIDELLQQIEALPLTDPERIAGYREIEDIVVNQDVAWVGLNNGTAASLGVSYIHDDFMSPIYGWPYLETAWSENA
jgi:ABC-type transport system substrate-binding protein